MHIGLCLVGHAAHTTVLLAGLTVADTLCIEIVEDTPGAGGGDGGRGGLSGGLGVRAADGTTVLQGMRDQKMDVHISSSQSRMHKGRIAEAH